MSYLHKLWLPGLLAWALVGHAEVRSEQYLQHGLSYDGPQVMYHEGRPWVAYIDAQSQLHFKVLKGTPQDYVVEAQGKPELENTYIGLWPNQGRVLLVWRPKLAQDLGAQPRGTKLLRASVLSPGATTFTPPQQLNQEGGAFNPTSYAFGAEGRIYTTWEDERTQRYGVFLNYSEDFGKTWQADDLRIDNLYTEWTEPVGGLKARVDMTAADAEIYALRAFNPFVTVIGQRVAVGWIEQYSGEGNLLRMRQSQDGGKTWCNAYTIFRPQVPIYNPKILRFGDELMIVFYAREAGIMSLRSKDQGLTWEGPVALPNTEVIGGQGYTIAQNSHGNVCLAWPGPNTLADGRFADVFALCSADSGKTWGEATRLDTDAPMSSHSLIPMMVMDEAGRVLVAWRDSRNIRSDVYVRYSLDAGKTWSPADYRLDAKPGERVSSYIALATDGQGEFTLVWDDALDDSTSPRYQLMYETLRLPDMALASAPERNLATEKEVLADQDPQRQARLVERVKAYWQARVDDDYKTLYTMLDPYYRLRASMMQYGAMMENYKFYSFAITPDSIDIKGNRAALELQASFEGRNPVAVAGKLVKDPRATRELFDKWVWIDGDWFKVWEINGQSFIPL